MSWRLRLLPYDLYERHAVVGRLLRRVFAEEQQKGCVLDVGGRTGLLQRFTPYEVVSLNVDGTADLRYDGRTIPFAANAFDAVINIDTLEHMPKAERLPFLQECLRVARRALIVAAPFGSPAHIAREKELDRLYRAAHGRPHPYLHEHLQYGLPTAAEVDELAAKLEAAAAQRFLAGDYEWQARHFEQALRARKNQGVGARLQSTFNHIAGLALFHPIRLRTRPYPAANRFYLLLQK